MLSNHRLACIRLRGELAFAFVVYASLMLPEQVERLSARHRCTEHLASAKPEAPDVDEASKPDLPAVPTYDHQKPSARRSTRAFDLRCRRHAVREEGSASGGRRLS